MGHFHSQDMISPKINEILIDFRRSKIYLKFLSYWFLEISCPDYNNVPLIFGDIRYIHVSKNQWDILLVMDFIDFIDFQRHSQFCLTKSIFRAINLTTTYIKFPNLSHLLCDKVKAKNYTLPLMIVKCKILRTVKLLFLTSLKV